jgi:membrane protein
VSLFLVVYRYASYRRPSLKASLVTAFLAGILFEVAKRLYGIYVRNAVFRQVSIDVDVGAMVLFVVWIYYSALVFLLGGVVAQVLDSRDAPKEPLPG